MPEEDMKDLSPEERIRKLKELEKKKKEEIEKARKMLKETEKELTEREEWKRKVPIPQVAAEEVSGMSEAEKEILRAHKGLREEREEVVEEVAEEGETLEKGKEREGREEVDLEETVARERAELPAELMENEYVVRRSQEPLENLYQELRGIQQESEERGYVSPERERRAEYNVAAIGRKVEDIEAGKYSLTEEVAEQALLTKSLGIGTSIIGEYMRRRGGQRDLYQR